MSTETFRLYFIKETFHCRQKIPSLTVPNSHVATFSILLFPLSFVLQLPRHITSLIFTFLDQVLYPPPHQSPFFTQPVKIQDRLSLSTFIIVNSRRFL